MIRNPGPCWKTIAFLLLQQGQVGEHRRLAEGEIERFRQEFEAWGSALPPELSEWGGYAAYFDGDFATAEERFRLLFESYTAAGRTVIKVGNFEPLCLFIEAAKRSGAEVPSELLPSLQSFIEKQVEAGFSHHQTAYRQALIAALTGDDELALFHLSVAVDRGWRSLADYIEDPIFSGVRKLLELPTLLRRNSEFLARERDLMPRPTLPSPPSTPQVTLSAEQMSEYTGRYRAGFSSVKIAEQDGALWAHPSEFPSRQLIPLGDDQFLLDKSSLRIEMFRDASGRVTHYENYYEGKVIRAKRVPATRIPAIIELTAEQLEPCVGVFTFPSLPQLNVRVSRQGTKLFIESTGSPRVEILPESKRSFYNEIFDSFVRFEQDRDGRFREIILQRPGNEMRGYRVEAS